MLACLELVTLLAFVRYRYIKLFWNQLENLVLMGMVGCLNMSIGMSPYLESGFCQVLSDLEMHSIFRIELSHSKTAL